MRLSLKAQRSQRKTQENRRVTTTIKEGLHLRVGNIAFEFLFYLLLMKIDFRSFWTTCFIFGYMSNAFLKIMSNINEINCQMCM
jgi:hypothetical protein